VLPVLLLLVLCAGVAPVALADDVPERAEPAGWRRTLERIASGVVAIKVDATRAFDTEWNESTQATGFVVDAARGLVLTNRHVVAAGPVRAEALFLNQEEVDLSPVYRDPVHDFGIFRYDPAQLRYIRPAEIPLAPQRAQVGREIRVVGNDAGEQLSILSGTIARLRRPAPDYGRGNYNDFNTFYLQAASGTSGGSSGSPVIDIGGRAVALNAGGSESAASSFFLPLDRVTRALDLIRAGQPVTRGYIGAIFVHRPFDELRRLGLSSRAEAQTRQLFPAQTGLLVVEQVIPGSSADGHLRVGDILLRVADRELAEFVPLEALLDDHVGDTLRLAVSRNGEAIEVALKVVDLHGVTPAEYLQFGDAVVHDLSLQQARHFNRPVDGVFVASPGYVLATANIPQRSIIVAVNEQPIHRLDDLEAVLARLADRERAAVRFVSFEDPTTSRLRVMRMDRRWFPVQRCRRDDARGVWPCRALASAPPAAAPQPRTVPLAGEADGAVGRAAASLVQVRFDMPYTVSGVAERHYYGTGVIVDAARGLVVVDRNTVPESIGDVQVTFGGSLEVPGRVVYLHPLHNLALVAYDPALIGATLVRSARLGMRLPEPGEQVRVLGLRPDFRMVFRTTEVASMEVTRYPLSRTIRFRQTNMETLDLVNGPQDIDGAIIDRRGDVVALWSSFSYQRGKDEAQHNRGIPAEYVDELLALARGERELRSLEVEWDQLPLAEARKLALPEDWAKRLQEHDRARAQVLSAVRTVAGTPAATLLQPGDLLLAIDGRPVTRLREAQTAARHAAPVLTVLRDGSPMSVAVPTVALDGQGVRRALMWAGALLQEPYREIAAQRGVEPYGVYVAYFAYGSPASRYGLGAGRRIVEVDGRPTPSLDSFIAAVGGRRDRAAVLLTTVTWNNLTEVLTLKLDRTYWPAYEIRYDSGDWHTSPVE
jgi:S1-C subfamily serine protease